MHYDAKFGSVTVRFVPLTVKQVEDMPDEVKILMGLKKFDFVFDSERMRTLRKLSLASAQRVDPSVTEAEIDKVFDMETIKNVTRILLGTDVAKEDADKTVPDSGEVKEPSTAANPTGPLIGGVSIAA